MRLFFIPIVAALFALSPAGVRAGEVPVELRKAWVRAVPPGSPATAAYMVIHNTGSEALQLTGGRVNFAAMVKPMITLRKTVDGKEVTGMELVDALDVPAGGETVLEPGGDHLMFMKITNAPSAGENVEVTLFFDPGAREITVKMPVARKAPE